MSTYKYGGEPERKISGPLPAGDYAFVVADCGEPYEKNNHWILPLRLTIQPSGVTVFANPWSGKTRDGEARWGIEEFLLCVNRAVAKGQEPDWPRVIGARGRCRLKLEVAQLGALVGQQVNKVAFFHRPHQLDREPGTPAANLRGSKQVTPGVPSDLDQEPDDIPF